MSVFAKRWLPLAAMLAIPLTLLVTLRWFPVLDRRWFSAYGHLLVVSAIAGCALLVAAAAAATAMHTRKASVVWMGIGCVIVGVAMLGHGLTTPGVWDRPSNAWVGRLPYVAMAGLAVSLAAAGSSPKRHVNRFLARRPLTSLLLSTLPITGLVVAVVVDTDSGATPWPHEETALDVLSIACALVLAMVTVTHWRRWHLGHDIVQLALAFAAAMSIAALTAFEHGVFGQVSWWDYHAYLLAAFGLTAYAVFVRGRRAHAVTEVLACTFDDDPFGAIVSGYPDALRTMVRAVELKDAYTHGHSARTAHLAVELGLRMRLPPDRLRVIARGAYLHDLGKIGIPDEILNKPGRLTAHERQVINTHPELGYEIAGTAISLREALPVILHHHERFDGQGYPAGLSGSDIPLEARVVTVADVWDALTSRRAYRKPMAPEDALAHIIAGAGSHFDPRVVDALVTHLRDVEGVSTDRRGEASEAWEAAQTCHEVREPVNA